VKEGGVADERKAREGGEGWGGSEIFYISFQ